MAVKRVRRSRRQGDAKQRIQVIEVGAGQRQLQVEVAQTQGIQQRAPGTYNHSMNVANLAEAAAESIKGNGLLAYVGALYHDAGKMSKPEYFVENQTPGVNRHDKLTPAMSLLVIVGHVKDGMELAREFNLPRGLHHFIEAHHGTTLVEYFYHRARKLAAGAGGTTGGSSGEPAEAPTNIKPIIAIRLSVGQFT